MKGVVGINRLQMTDERILAFIQRNFRCRFLDIIMPIISAMGNVVGLEEINRLLATGRWKVRSLDWDDEIPVAKLVRNKR